MSRIRQLCATLIALSLVISGISPIFAAAQSEVEPPLDESAAIGAGYHLSGQLFEETTPPETESIESTEAQETDDSEESETLPEPSIPEQTEEAIPAQTEPEETLPPETQPQNAPSWTAVFDHDFPLYSQQDYPDTRYANGTVASNGCSVTSLAMVATYLTGHSYYPDELAKYFGGYGENNVQRLEYGAQQLRLPIHKAENILEIFDALKQGDVAILLMNHMSIFTETQHFIVLTGINEQTGKIMVHDSFAPNYEKWDLKRGFVQGFDEGDLILGYDGGWIFSVRGMPEVPFIYKEEKPKVTPRYPEVKLTWEEQQLLAKLIWLEARGESREGQQAVAEVVLNRLVSGKYGATLSNVIYGENQFRSTPLLDKAEAWQAQYEAIDAALEGPYILPKEVVHFATYPENDNVWGKIGGHYFCYAP